MTTDAPKRTKRPDRSGSLHMVNRTVRGKTYQRWRATGYYAPPGEKPKLFKGEGATPQAATEALQRKITNTQIEYGVIGADALALPAKTLARTLKAVIDEWLAHESPDLRENSLRGYEAKIRNYIDPYLGATPIRLLTHDQLNEFVWQTLPSIKDSNQKQILGSTAMRQTYAVLNAVLQYSVKHGYIDRNPLSTVKAPKRNRRTKDHIEELRNAAQWVPAQIIKTVHGKPNELRWLLALHGMRQGEVLGLTDDCIRWRKGVPTRIKIKQQLDRITATHGCGDYDSSERKWACGKQADRCPDRRGETKLYIREETKTESGDRELPLSPELKDALIRHLAYRDELRASPQFQPINEKKMDTLLFVKPNGRPIRPQEDRKDWEQVLKDAKVTNRVSIPLRVHDARHLAATIAFQAGISPQKMSMIFGWSPRHVQDMMLLYAHPSSKTIQEEMDTLSSLLSKRVKPPTETQ